MTGRLRSVLTILIAAVAIFIVFVLVKVTVFEHSGKICRDVAVSGNRIGGLDRNSARAVIESWARRLLKRHVTLVALDLRQNWTFLDLGVRVPVDELLDRAYMVGREGGIVSRFICVATPWGANKRINVDLHFDKNVLRKRVVSIAAIVDRAPKNARLKVVAGRLQVVPEQFGFKIDREQAVNLIKRRIIDGALTVSLPIVVNKPAVTVADAVQITTLLSSYTTSFNPAKVERTHNLQLAAEAINGVVVKPGMVFSANETIGPRLVARGFKPAQIFVRGKLEEGIGGGVCQVSSTLYNAVLLAGLKVLERSHHSRVVPYVAPGRDATVVYGLVDFKFRNSNSAPIGIIAQIRGSRLTVSIYGSPADKRVVKVYTSIVRRIPAGVRIVKDPSLLSGFRRIIDKGASGVFVIVYRTITHGDGRTVSEVVSRDRYLPQDTIVAVGTGSGTAAHYSSTQSSEVQKNVQTEINNQ
ncbi:MAG: VanW family protein [Armatimonadota bacterium]